MEKKLSYLLLVVVFFALTGCNGANTNRNLNIKKNGDLTFTEVEGDIKFQGREILFTPDIKQITGTMGEDKLIGYIDSEYSRSLYLFDLLKNQVKKIATPKSGFKILSAVTTNNNIIWTECNKKHWYIYKKNLKDGTQQELDRGKYFVGGGAGYPKLAITNRKLFFNTSIPGEKMISQIVQLNLDSEDKTIVHEIKGNEIYLGTPDAHNGNVVWHLGEWTKRMKSEVYLYEIKTKKLSKISGNQPAISPDIWKNYVVWTTYSPNLPELKNVELYNIENKKTKKITHYEEDSHMEAWGPSISENIVAWKINQVKNLNVYSVNLDKIIEVKAQTYFADVFGCWLVWLPSPDSEKEGVYLCKV